MIKKLTLMLLIVLMLAAPAYPAGKGKFIPTDPILPLSQVKKGMKVEVRTVLHGTSISSFSATLLGVVPRKASPRNLILIRIDDPAVRKNGGIAAGMSGSPVYAGGRLVGAIGYGWEFNDNNLGLVTPIEEMIKAFDWPEKIPPFGVSAKIPKDPAGTDVKPVSADVVSKDIKTEPLSKDVPPEKKDIPADVVSKDVLPDAVSSSDISMLAGAQLKPLAMPILADGISARMTGEIKKRLGLSLIPLGGASSDSGSVRMKAQPKPGSAIGVSLAWGDLQIGGIGTLTAKSADGRFLAFGHPMENRGSVAFPLTEASILQVIPGISSSFKLGYQGPIIGIVTQDRPEAIAGYIGKLAPAISYTVRFHNIDTKKRIVKRFQTPADSFSGPVIGALGMLGIIDDMWARKGEGTAILKYRFSGGNLPKGWERRNIFFSDTDLVSSLLKEFDDLAELFALNQFQEIRPFAVDLDVEITTDPRVVFIEKLDIIDKKDFYSPGDKIELAVTMRPWRKRSVIKKMSLTVPEKSVDFCEILLRGGGIDEPDQESLDSGLRAITNLDDLMKELSIAEANNQIIAEIGGPETMSFGKDKKELPPIEDMMDDRLLSEIRAERIKEGSLLIVDTNYYVNGLLRKIIKIKRPDGQTDEGPTEEEEAAMRASAEKMESKEKEVKSGPEGSPDSTELVFDKGLL